MFVFLQPEHAVEAPVEYDDDDASLSALDDDEDDSVDEDDNGNASVFLLYSMHEHLDLCMISHLMFHAFFVQDLIWTYL